MMWGHYDQFSWWWFVVMPLGMLGFWAVVAWVVITVVRGDRNHRVGPAVGPSPESILADRYARGEIDADEYHRRLDDLREAGVAPGGRS